MFWNVFYQLCEENNTKPNTVAKMIGVSSATCTKWKNGAVPNGETLLKLADYLDVSVDYLLGRTSDPNSINIKSNNVVNGDNGNNSPLTVNGTSQQDEMTEELTKRFKSLSFDEKIEVFNYIKNIKEE